MTRAQSSEFPRLLAFRLLELIAPTKNTSLGTMMLGFGLISALHPNT